MADSHPTSSAADQLRYPATFHLSIVGDARVDFGADVRAVLADYRVLAPLSDGLATPSGRHRALRVSVEVESRDRLDALDRTLRAVPGVRMIL